MDTTASTRKAERPPQRLVALLGRRDEPTDALRDYCAWLGEATRRRGIALEPVEVDWDRVGWLPALWKLWKQGASWKGRWVLLQYTALMWSRRGFPLAILVLLRMLKFRRCRTAVVFHDVYAVPSPTWIDRFRVGLQRRVMRSAYRCANRSVLPVPLDRVPWLPAKTPKAVFIPVGANIPSLDDLLREGLVPMHRSPPTVAVFGVSGWPSAQKQEVEAIINAMRCACSQLGELRLLVMGRGAEEAEAELRAGLSGSPVLLNICGLLSSREISARLSCCDLLLFVRPLSSRRGSGLAGIACGLPIVAYEGLETAFPLTEAGVLFIPYNDRSSLPDQLIRVLRDANLRQALRARSMRVFREWFSWDRIAERLIEALDYSG